MSSEKSRDKDVKDLTRGEKQAIERRLSYGDRPKTETEKKIYQDSIGSKINKERVKSSDKKKSSRVIYDKDGKAKKKVTTIGKGVYVTDKKGVMKRYKADEKLKASEVEGVQGLKSYKRQFYDKTDKAIREYNMAKRMNMPDEMEKAMKKANKYAKLGGMGKVYEEEKKIEIPEKSRYGVNIRQRQDKWYDPYLESVQSVQDVILDIGKSFGYMDKHSQVTSRAIPKYVLDELTDRDNSIEWDKKQYKEVRKKIAEKLGYTDKKNIDYEEDYAKDFNTKEEWDRAKLGYEMVAYTLATGLVSGVANSLLPLVKGSKLGTLALKTVPHSVTAYDAYLASPTIIRYVTNPTPTNFGPAFVDVLDTLEDFSGLPLDLKTKMKQMKAQKKLELKTQKETKSLWNDPVREFEVGHKEVTNVDKATMRDLRNTPVQPVMKERTVDMVDTPDGRSVGIKAKTGEVDAKLMQTQFNYGGEVDAKYPKPEKKTAEKQKKLSEDKHKPSEYKGKREKPESLKQETLSELSAEEDRLLHARNVRKLRLMRDYMGSKKGSLGQQKLVGRYRQDMRSINSNLDYIAEQKRQIKERFEGRIDNSNKIQSRGRSKIELLSKIKTPTKLDLPSKTKLDLPSKYKQEYKVETPIDIRNPTITRQKYGSKYDFNNRLKTVNEERGKLLTLLENNNARKVVSKFEKKAKKKKKVSGHRPIVKKLDGKTYRGKLYKTKEQAEAMGKRIIDETRAKEFETTKGKGKQLYKTDKYGRNNKFYRLKKDKSRVVEKKKYRRDKPREKFGFDFMKYVN